MIRSLLAVLLMTVQFACGEVPRLFKEKDFRAAHFAEAVNYFVALGEDEAVRQLEELAPGRGSNGKLAFHMNERVGWMCRVLFEPKGAEPLREPRFGALRLPYLSMPAKNWPLYPVALSGSTYFVLSEGYSLGGLAEDTGKYLQYCRKAGTFRKKPVPVPDKAQAAKDAAALKESEVWKGIKWKDSGPGTSYTMSEGWTWKFIQAQADGIS
ncbi:MAG TPA: hypothetical protein VG796_12275 [Verrucomicrobiales bacterium]|nr:hypothetical protein [Verrucomicrobiales bacterium]